MRQRFFARRFACRYKYMCGVGGGALMVRPDPKKAAPAPSAATGGMAERVRDFGWAATPLGPMSDWPAELKTVVGFVLESSFPKAIVWGPELVTIHNDAFLPILGNKPEALGRSFKEVWAEAWGEIGPIAARAFAGEATYIEDFPLEIDRSGRLEQAWFTFCYSPLRLADGTVAGMMDTVVETTATVRAKAQLDVVTHELSHRLKNTMAMVQAIAAQTLKEVAEREAVEAFNNRIVTMGHAHDVLLRQDWSAASLEQTARAAMAPLDGLQQVSVEGPPVQIGPRATIALSLMLHELATNATKYGALSTPQGRVELAWMVEGGLLKLCWRESGGPPVRAPSRKGFGTRLIDMGLAPGGSVQRRYLPAGFEADIIAPVAELAQG